MVIKKKSVKNMEPLFELIGKIHIKKFIYTNLKAFAFHNLSQNISQHFQLILYVNMFCFNF
jgi:hypothetical protein